MNYNLQNLAINTGSDILLYKTVVFDFFMLTTSFLISYICNLVTGAV